MPPALALSVRRSRPLHAQRCFNATTVPTAAMNHRAVPTFRAWLDDCIHLQPGSRDAAWPCLDARIKHWARPSRCSQRLPAWLTRYAKIRRFRAARLVWANALCESSQIGILWADISMQPISFFLWPSWNELPTKHTYFAYAGPDQLWPGSLVRARLRREGNQSGPKCIWVIFYQFLIC